MTDSATVEATNDVYFDPYDVEINADPYPVFARLREEAPLYYNAQHDFYALSRLADVNRALVDHETFSSAQGAIIELIKADFEIPSGVLIFEDPPIHDIHRKLLARMFTPRKIAAAGAQDPRVLRREPRPAGRHGQVRLRHRLRRHHADEGHQRAARHPRGRPGDDPRPRQRPDADRGRQADEGRRGRPRRRRHLRRLHRLAQVDNPSDDIMTELLNVEFADEHGRDAQAHPRRAADLHQRGRGRGQRHHHPADRLGRRRFWPNIPTSGASSSRTRR